MEPLSAEQSVTKDNDEETYGAWRAIDGDMSTRSFTANGSENWLRVDLDGMNCVQQVMWYYNKPETPATTWTCSEDGCTCAGKYCSWSSVEVGTGDQGVGEVSAAGGYAECKRGNAVLFKFTSSWDVVISEIKITGLINSNTGKIHRHDRQIKFHSFTLCVCFDLIHTRIYKVCCKCN